MDMSLFGFKFKKSRKKTNSSFQKQLNKYPYSLQASLAVANVTRKNKFIEKLSWMSFDRTTLLLSFLDKPGRKLQKSFRGVKCVDLVQFKKYSKSSSKKKKKKLIEYTSSLGENVSDKFETMEEPAIEHSSSKFSKTKTIKKKATSKKTTQRKHWRDWASSYNKPIKLSDYTKWLNELEKAEAAKTAKIANSKSKINKERKKSKKLRLQAKIDKSIIINEAIVSEPLANLLYEQGHHNEALKMFEKLSLIFPEKSTFFADKIKALKK